MKLSELKKLNDIKKRDKEWSIMSNDKDVVLATMDDLINIPHHLKEKLKYLNKLLIVDSIFSNYKKGELAKNNEIASICEKKEKRCQMTFA